MTLIKALGWKSFKPHHICSIALLLALILASASDSCNNKDILLMVGFNYTFTQSYVDICMYMMKAAFLVKLLKGTDLLDPSWL